MPGFRYCSWCNGRGCMCCDAEEAKWKSAEAKRKEQEAAEDPREKLARLTNPLMRSLITAMSCSRAEKEAVEQKLDAEIAAAEAACDAEYNRQFPDGPTPMFTVRTGNAKDMELLQTAFHADVITKAFGPDGGGMAEIERLAAEARAKQDPPVDYKPIGQKAPRSTQ